MDRQVVPKRRRLITDLRRVRSQKTEDLNFTTTADWHREIFKIESNEGGGLVKPRATDTNTEHHNSDGARRHSCPHTACGT